MKGEVIGFGHQQICKPMVMKWVKVTLIYSVILLGGAVATGTSFSFKDGKLVQDKEHLAKELGGLVDLAIENLSVEHMEFYFFKMHDLDGDQHLDGNELYAAISEASIKLNEESTSYSPSAAEEYLIGAVDSLLNETDENGDGLVSWTEYLSKTRYFDNVDLE